MIVRSLVVIVPSLVAIVLSLVAIVQSLVTDQSQGLAIDLALVTNLVIDLPLARGPSLGSDPCLKNKLTRQKMEQHAPPPQ